MKTGQYYFEQLSEKEQEEFTRNQTFRSKEQFERALSMTDLSFYDFIASYFVWHTTPQGFDYWSEISNRKVD